MINRQYHSEILKIALSCLITLCYVGPLHANVYKCENKGVVEFSQFPCGENAEFIVVKEQKSVPTPKVILEATGEPDIDSYIRLKQIDAQIQQHQDKIDTLSVKMNKIIAALVNQSDAQLNNLSGAKKDIAIANQMTNASQRFTVLIEREQHDIDRLVSEKKHLKENQNSDVKSTQTPQSKGIDSFIRLQTIKREMQRHQAKINTYQINMNQQISALEDEVSEQPTNITDATYDDSLSRRMEAVTSKYHTLIDVEQRQIDRLHSEMISLQ